MNKAGLCVTRKILALHLFVISFISILTVGVALAGEPVVKASVDKRSIYIGDRIKYAIEVAPREDLEIEFPRFENNKIGDFEIKDSGGNWYILTTYSIGEHRIPSLEVKYKRKDSESWGILKTLEIIIMVKSVLPDKEVVTDVKDIKGPLYFYEINWLLISAISGGLVFLILAVMAYKKRRAKKILFKLPHEIALEKLEEIRGLFSKTGNVKEYYIRVSDCVRHYIERRFRVRAPEMTTEEFLDSLRESNALSFEREGRLLKEFLEACDLVKFAKYMPKKIEVEAIFTTAKKFVEETKEDVHV